MLQFEILDLTVNIKYKDKQKIGVSIMNILYMFNIILS